MKQDNSKYLQAVLLALQLIEDGQKGTSVNFEIIEAAAQWALHDGEYRIKPYSAVALKPVLATLKNGVSNTFFKPQHLSLGSDFFPNPNDGAPNESILVGQLEKLKLSLSEAQSDGNLLTPLEYHGSTLAIDNKWPDLPLFDFVKVSAAIAHCLENGTGKLRLFAGSVSGIQHYLYDIASKRASKLLKGRSFYLHLLTDTIAQEVLDHFHLSACHILYNSGGGFFVLFPDTPSVLEDYEDFRKKATANVFKYHQLGLFVDFAITQPFDSNTPVTHKWDELFGKLHDAKLQRLSGNPILVKKLLEEPAENGGETQRDAITNEELNNDADTDSLGTGEDKIIVSKFTKGQVEQLGRNLRQAKYWITSDQEKFHRDAFKDPFGKWHVVAEAKPGHLPADANVRVINEPNPCEPFIFYGGNKAPTFDAERLREYADKQDFSVGDPLPFDFLAEGAQIDRLGILRMDVDGLGAIFSEQIGVHPSLTRYAAVSRSLDWFFKGYLNTIHSQVRYYTKTIIIYSGGDDLFIVGRWKEVLDMAFDIRSAFDKWTGGGLTLSGGLVIVPPKFPVMQGAKLAGKAEGCAKDYTLHPAGKPEKNALTFLGIPFSWSREIPLLKALRLDLLELLEAEKVDNSLLDKINIHASGMAYQELNNLPRRWMWLMAYDFSRLEHRIRDKHPDAADKLQQLRIDAFTNKSNPENPRKHHFLLMLQTAARWVELERRTNGVNRE